MLLSYKFYSRDMYVIYFSFLTVVSPQINRSVNIFINHWNINLVEPWRQMRTWPDIGMVVVMNIKYWKESCVDHCVGEAFPRSDINNLHPRDDRFIFARMLFDILSLLYNIYEHLYMYLNILHCKHSHWSWTTNFFMNSNRNVSVQS